MNYAQRSPTYKLDTLNISLDDDYEGKVSAKVDFCEIEDAKTAVIYVHGYMDYFFQRHMADFFIDKGISFYALELRKYGSSIKTHQHENFCKDIREYYAELTFVIKKAKEAGHQNIILHGHSTGGLIVTHYLQHSQHRDLISGAILNSPFFAFNASSTAIKLLSIVAPIGKLFPFLKFTQLNSLYTESLHKDYRGRWDFNLHYKPIPSFISYFGWMHAILNAQYEIYSSTIDELPCLILHSDTSYFKTTWSDKITSSDGVLNVNDIVHYGEKIYKNLTLITVKDAVHDIVLSSDPVIEQYFSDISSWLEKNPQFQ